MKYDPEAVALAFQSLFLTYRFVDPSEADDMLRVYFEALTDYETRDIESGIRNMLSGKVDGFNPSFLPPAPLVAKCVREALYRRLDAEARDRKALPPPADDWVEPSPEAKARMRDQLQALSDKLKRDMDMENAEADAQFRDLQRRTNERFDREARWSAERSDDDGDMGMLGKAS